MSSIFNRNGIVISNCRWVLLNGKKEMYFTVKFSFGGVLFVYTTVNGYEAVFSENGNPIPKNKRSEGRKTFFEKTDDLTEHILWLHGLGLKKDITFTKEIVKDKIFLTVYYDITAKIYDCFLDESGYIKDRSLSKLVFFNKEEELDDYVLSLRKKYKV